MAGSQVVNLAFPHWPSPLALPLPQHAPLFRATSASEQQQKRKESNVCTQPRRAKASIFETPPHAPLRVVCHNCNTTMPHHPGLVQFSSTVQQGTAWYCTVQRSAMKCSTTHSSTVEKSTVQYSTAQSRAVLVNWRPPRRRTRKATHSRSGGDSLALEDASTAQSRADLVN